MRYRLDDHEAKLLWQLWGNSLGPNVNNTIFEVTFDKSMAEIECLPELEKTDRWNDWKMLPENEQKLVRLLLATEQGAILDFHVVDMNHDLVRVLVAHPHFFGGDKHNPRMKVEN